ncbi:MAG: hypothetical protein U9R19_18325 [Bacteroidota bacterium]|nr:hypothetical protein [Bacteroidota bacterium]
MKIKTVLLITMFVAAGFLLSAQGLKVEPGTCIKVETGTTLDISGGGDLTLKSDATGDASLIDLGSVSYTGGGEANVERYLSNGTWHLISSPIVGAESGMFTGDYLQYHTESSNLYTDVTSTTYGLVPMKGYSLWSMQAAPPSNTTELFEGVTNTGSQAFNFTKAGDGYNLMGNPYPSVIDWDEVTIPANLNGSFQLWDPSTGVYKYYQKTGGPGNTTSQYIPSGQGFFTWATGTGTFTLDNTVRTQASQSFYKNTNTTNTMLVLKVTGNSITTQTAIGFNQVATPQIDRLFDVPMIVSGYPDVPNLYSFSEGKEMAINTLPSILGYETIPVSFHAGTTGNYSILASELQSIPAEVPVYLEDVALNHIHDLRLDPGYSFAYTSGAIKEFKVHFENLITEIEETETLQVLCYTANEMLHVKFLTKGTESESIQANIRAYDITGKQLLDVHTTQTDNALPFNYKQSVYLIHISAGNMSYSTKVFNR